MSFTNKKEDVISMELTEHGRDLLRQGIFEPVFYSFHDADVVYDNAYGEATTQESPEDAYLRIKESTQNKPTPSIWKGNPILETENASSLPIGTNDASPNKIPAFEIKLLDGAEIESITPTYKAGPLENLPIPQINLKGIVANLKFRDLNEEEIEEIQDDFIFSSFEADANLITRDNKKLEVEVPEISIQIEEKNVNSGFQDFEIEVFEVVSSQDPQRNYETLKSIGFLADPTEMIDGILLEEPIIPNYSSEDYEKSVDAIFQFRFDESVLGRRKKHLAVPRHKNFNQNFRPFEDDEEC